MLNNYYISNYFQGLIIGNAYVDPAMIFNITKAFYYFGLLEQNQLDTIRPLVESFQQDIVAKRSVEAKNVRMPSSDYLPCLLY